jgi:hypothetical protein
MARATKPKPAVILKPKLSTKVIVGKVEKPEEETHLYNVYGIANSVITGESTFGAWVAFKGDFRAVDSDGNTYQAGKVFLPVVASNLLEAAVNSGDGIGVEFAFAISVAPADNAVGYEYNVTPLIEAAETSPLLMLENRLQGA